MERCRDLLVAAIEGRDAAGRDRLSGVLDALLHLDGEVRRHAEPRFLVEATLVRLAVEPPVAARLASPSQAPSEPSPEPPVGARRASPSPAASEPSPPAQPAAAPAAEVGVGWPPVTGTGGESTALSLLLDFEDMRGAIGSFAARGGALFGTCAGLILLAREVVPGHPSEPPVETLGLLDVAVARNDYGRQRESFEAAAPIAVIGEERFPLAFIRAPRIVSVGRAATPLAWHAGDVVLVRQGRVLAASSERKAAERVSR